MRAGKGGRAANVTDSDVDWLRRGPGLQCPVLDNAILPAIAARLTAALAPPAHPLTPLVVDGQVAGWLDAARAERLAAFGAVFDLDRGALTFVPAVDRADDRTAAVAEVARTLAAEGALSAWRDERYAVAPAFGAPPWFLLERAAARYFGVRTFAAHVNGLVRGLDAGAPAPAVRRCGSRGVHRPRRSTRANSTTSSAAASPPA